MPHGRSPLPPSVGGGYLINQQIGVSHTSVFPQYTNARLKVYPCKTTMQVASRDIFTVTPGCTQPRGYDVPPPGLAADPERALYESKRRARSKVRDIAFCNDFSHFFTWTLNGQLVDRYSAEVVYRKAKSFLLNAVRRKGFAYVAVPEYHRRKPGEATPAIHIHGLCKLGAVPIVRAVSSSGMPLFDDGGRPIYNMPSWTWGYSTCVPLDEQYERAIYYLTKYITKSEGKIFGKWYLSSRHLRKSPELIPVEPIPYYEFRDDRKLKVHEQYEGQIYPGLRIILKDFPPLGDDVNNKEYTTDEETLLS